MQQPMVKASTAEPIVISRRLSENVPPMDEEERAARSFTEKVIHQLSTTWHFCMNQPLIALLFLFMLYHLVSISRTLSRMESHFEALLELHKATLAQTTDTTTIQEQVQDI